MQSPNPATTIASQGTVTVTEQQQDGNQLTTREQLVMHFESPDKHLKQLSNLAAHQLAKELLQMLRERVEEDRQGKRNLVLQLRSLIEQSSLLSANQLRALVKTELFKQCIQMWKNDDPDLAAQLSFCLLQTLLIELAYLRAVSTEKSQRDFCEEAQTIWAGLISEIENFDNCPFHQLASLLLLNAIQINEEDNEEMEEIQNCIKKIGKRIWKRKLLEICVEKLEDGKNENAKELRMEIDGEENLEMPADCSYNSVLFDLLSRFLVTFCLLNSKLHFPIINFLVAFAQKRNSLGKLLHLMAKNPEIRFNTKIRESIESILLQIVPEQRGKIRWAKLAGESVESAGKKRRRRTQNCTGDDNGDLPQDWDGLLAIFEDENATEDEQMERLARSFVHLSSAKLQEILSTAEFHPKSAKSARSILRLLFAMACQRKSLQIPLRLEMAELIVAEPEPKIISLQLAVKMLPMLADQLDTLPHLPDFCGLCLATFVPYEKLQNQPEIGENARRQFLISQLTFLRSLLIWMPKLLGGLAPLIVQLLPDFFIQASEYRCQRASIADWRQDQFADRLEHSLAGVCREIGKRRKYFTRLLPFVVANSLSGERDLRFPMFLLLSALDPNDMAVLSANLPTMEKRKFELLQQQFHECNKIIG